MMLVMHPDRVYDFPIWAVAALVIGVAVSGAVALELLVRLLFSLDRRRTQNDVAAALFSVVGVLYAVLLAFIAMLAWEGFNTAKAASFREAASIAEVWDIAMGLPDQTGPELRGETLRYAHAVVDGEWPAQARGERNDAAMAPLEALHRLGNAVRPQSAGEINLHRELLSALSRLDDARQERVLAAETTVPSVAWAVMLAGAAITIAFASFLRAPSLAMHLAMSAALALSGALVLVLIVALSNPFRGDFRVSTEPFDRVIARMNETQGRG